MAVDKYNLDVIRQEKLPQIPKRFELNSLEQKFYIDIARKTASVKTLSDLDGFQIANCARIAALYEKAYKMLSQKGMIQKAKSGHRNVSPEWVVWTTLEGKLRKAFELLMKDAKSEDANKIVDKFAPFSMT